METAGSGTSAAFHEHPTTILYVPAVCRFVALTLATCTPVTGSVTDACPFDRNGPGGGADFQTFLFGKAWGSLSSVTLRGMGSRQGVDYYAVDDIVVDRASVPEPGTLILLGVGSAFALERRRRNHR